MYVYIHVYVCVFLHITRQQEKHLQYWWRVFFYFTCGRHLNELAN